MEFCNLGLESTFPKDVVRLIHEYLPWERQTSIDLQKSLMAFGCGFFCNTNRIYFFANRQLCIFDWKGTMIRQSRMSSKESGDLLHVEHVEHKEILWILTWGSVDLFSIEFEKLRSIRPHPPRSSTLSSFHYPYAVFFEHDHQDRKIVCCMNVITNVFYVPPLGFDPYSSVVTFQQDSLLFQSWNRRQLSRWNLLDGSITSLFYQVEGEIEKLVANSDFIAVLYRYGMKLHIVDVKNRLVSVIEEKIYDLDQFKWCGNHLIHFDSLHYELHVYSPFGGKIGTS